MALPEANSFAFKEVDIELRLTESSIV